MLAHLSKAFMVRLLSVCLFIACLDMFLRRISEKTNICAEKNCHVKLLMFSVFSCSLTKEETQQTYRNVPRFNQNVINTQLIVCFQYQNKTIHEILNFLVCSPTSSLDL